MEPIGGYFEWEFPRANKKFLHDNAVFLNSGRHALEYILRGIPGIKNIWIPFFTCDVVLQPLQRLGIPWKFYHIDEKLEIADKLELETNEILLYTNYYGIKDEYCGALAQKYGTRIIIDHAQALFCRSYPESHQFYSPRKFMGMPDGGLAVTPNPGKINELLVDKSYDRCSHLLKRLELDPSEGYNDFKEASKKIATAPLSRMSNISRSILSSVDLDEMKLTRRRNFAKLHDALSGSNRLAIPPMDSFECPLVYPYWASNGDALKKKLIEKKIFVATYWPNVLSWVGENDLEYDITNHVVCLPIDQRYGIKDMERITSEIL